MFLDIYMCGVLAMAIMTYLWDMTVEDMLFGSLLWFLILPLGIYIRLTEDE